MTPNRLLRNSLCYAILSEAKDDGCFFNSLLKPTQEQQDIAPHPQPRRFGEQPQIRLIERLPALGRVFRQRAV